MVITFLTFVMLVFATLMMTLGWLIDLVRARFLFPKPSRSHSKATPINQSVAYKPNQRITPVLVSEFASEHKTKARTAASPARVQSA